VSIAALSIVAVSVAALLSSGCDEGRDVRVWQPGDHDGEAKNAGQVDGVAAPGEEDATLVSMTWKQNCLRCHGASGRGDGPEGRMLRVPDLSATKGTDQELANTIRKGRNQMPAFGEALTPNVVDGLVRLIRSFNARGPKKP
jgi:cytochrome c oxidase cbb3-type subunit 3